MNKLHKLLIIALLLIMGGNTLKAENLTATRNSETELVTKNQDLHSHDNFITDDNHVASMLRASVAEQGYSLDIASGDITLTETDGVKYANGIAYEGELTVTDSNENEKDVLKIESGEHNVTISSIKVKQIAVSSGAKLNLTLAGTNTVTAPENGFAAIHVPKGAELVITESSQGSVTATGRQNCAGIGGQLYGTSGKITILGGTVNATGGYRGAGIGGGYHGNGTNITISGGTVNATGGYEGAGIGGSGGDGTNITISGGTVNATGGDEGAGIGGGDGTDIIVFPEEYSAITVKETEEATDIIGKYTQETDVTSAVDGKKYLYIYTTTCGGNHVDEDDNHKCDVCDAYIDELHTDENGDHKCDICDYTLSCDFDENNGFCSICGDYQPATLVTNENYESLGLASEYVGFYQIGNAGQLFWFANHVNTADRTASAILTADIDLENRPWTPIGSTGQDSHNFRGVFDGQNHTITGLYVEGGRAGLGFFGEVRTGTVKNFTIYGEVVVNTEVNYVGGVIGSTCGLNGSDHGLEHNGATIQNITSYVNLTAKTHGIGMVGGFIGYANHETLIENCSWYGTFDAGIYRVDSGAGGFIGRLYDTSDVTVRNCAAYGTIKTAYKSGTFENYSTIYIGGFLSYSPAGAQTVLENNLWAGEIINNTNLEASNAHLSAFGTMTSFQSITNCYALNSTPYVTTNNENDNDITTVTAERLASGEIAYLLQGEQETQVWGQNIDNGEMADAYPVLGGAKVYKHTFDFGNINVYSNLETLDMTPHGKCGDYLYWNITDSTLTIFGTGAMWNYDNDSNKAPWREYSSILKTLVLEEGMTSIGKYAFYRCSGFTENLIIPNSVTSIGYVAFNTCKFTGSLTIPNNVTSIGDYAFTSCNFRGSLTIGNSVTSIGRNAFSQCYFTGSLIIPNSVTYIGNEAFNCYGLTDIFFYRNESPSIAYINTFANINSNAKIYAPVIWESFTNIPEDKLVKMPTWTSQQVNETTSQQVWVGLAEGQTEPGENEHVAINAPLFLSQRDNETTSQQVNSLRVKSFGYCGDGTTTNGSITIEEGGQLYCETARGEVTVRKEIIGYAGQQTTDNGQQTSWYTIASPLKDVTSTSLVSGLLTTEYDYDLYRYDEPTYTWQNAKPGEGSTNFQTIEPGRGYLYANAENTTLEFTGDINTEDVNYTLTAQSEVLNGFHLVGNPYTHDISFNHLSADAELANGYYVLNGEGAWGATLGNEGDVIKVGQGALIKTIDAGTLMISKSQSRNDAESQSRDASMNPAKSTNIDTSQQPTISLIVSNAKYSDKAFVVFDEGVGLDKINHENENIPLLYIPQGDTDYAIAMMDENVSEIPVSFEAMTMGQYTISLQQENCDFEELYLLDKETGEKVNILEEDYTFMATTADNAERFILLKANSQQPTANSSHFAYQSGEDLIISIEGSVQIIDVMGRIIYSNDVTSDNIGPD